MLFNFNLLSALPKRHPAIHQETRCRALDKCVNGTRCSSHLGILSSACLSGSRVPSCLQQKTVNSCPTVCYPSRLGTWSRLGDSSHLSSRTGSAMFSSLCTASSRTGAHSKTIVLRMYFERQVTFRSPRSACWWRKSMSKASSISLLRRVWRGKSKDNRICQASPRVRSAQSGAFPSAQPPTNTSLCLFRIRKLQQTCSAEYYRS